MPCKVPINNNGKKENVYKKFKAKYHIWWRHWRSLVGTEIDCLQNCPRPAWEPQADQHPIMREMVYALRTYTLLGMKKMRSMSNVWNKKPFDSHERNKDHWNWVRINLCSFIFWKSSYTSRTQDGEEEKNNRQKDPKCRDRIGSKHPNLEQIYFWSDSTRKKNGWMMSKEKISYEMLH